MFVQPWPAGPSDRRRDQVRYYRYKHDRARRTLKGIDEQVGWQDRGQAQPVRQGHRRHQDRQPGTGGQGTRAGSPGSRATSPTSPTPTPEFVIGAYQRLFQIEKSSRMAKSDLAARPIFHRTKDSIEAHLTIVCRRTGHLPLDRDTTGRTIRKFVKTVRRYLTIQIQAGDHTITAADPIISRRPHRPRSHPRPSRGALK